MKVSICQRFNHQTAAPLFKQYLTDRGRRRREEGRTQEERKREGDQKRTGSQERKKVEKGMKSRGLNTKERKG